MPVVDQHDDLCGLFRSSGPKDGLEFLKTASWKERDDLYDRDFALIIVDNQGKEHRKFACHDVGNTFLSQWYLLNAEHDLPAGAVKVAAANLLNAADDLGLQSHPALYLLANEGEDLPGDGRRVLVKSASSTQYAKTASFEPSQIARPMGKGMSQPLGTHKSSRHRPLMRSQRRSVGGTTWILTTATRPQSMSSSWQVRWAPLFRITSSATAGLL